MTNPIGLSGDIFCIHHNCELSFFVEYIEDIENIELGRIIAFRTSVAPLSEIGPQRS